MQKISCLIYILSSSSPSFTRSRRPALLVTPTGTSCSMLRILSWQWCTFHPWILDLLSHPHSSNPWSIAIPSLVRSLTYCRTLTRRILGLLPYPHSSDPWPIATPYLLRSLTFEERAASSSCSLLLSRYALFYLAWPCREFCAGSSRKVAKNSASHAIGVVAQELKTVR